MNMLEKNLAAAVEASHLLKSAAENISFYYSQSGCQQWEKDSIQELLADAQWTELNDRFYKTLAFGTGGLRGRTIGRVVTQIERGQPNEKDRPEFPAVGTNMMNYFSVGRATQGLCHYLKNKFSHEMPKLVISHDTRHFSRDFAELAAKIATELGVNAFLFEADRSTPELSFAVRYLNAHAGIMLTASHNPPHDNGFKAYFQDGGQIVEPHASGIIKEVLAVKSGAVEVVAHEQGQVTLVGKELDDAYIEAMHSLVLDERVLREQSDKLKVVFTPIHGTGGRIIPQLLEKYGCKVIPVPSQAEGDGRFPTVKSPNPENAEALSLAIEKAKLEEADLLCATDPDADRMGVAVRNAAGEYEVITGNQIGAILASYRLQCFFDSGVLNESNAAKAVLIKTFVTTDLQKALAESYGVRCVETLTGFKYIGEKMKEYEEAAGGRGDLSSQAWRDKLLQDSSFFVFGGEESYGYSGGDYVRDKDANAAVLMLIEAASYAKSKDMMLLDYLDEIYVKFGFYFEKLGTLTFEGAEGAAKIKKLLQSYKDESPVDFNGKTVLKVQNFADDDYCDVDGKAIPKELMLLFHLKGGARIAVRASGTEPKIKFYFFNKADVVSEKELQGVKANVKTELEALWDFTREDIKKRVG
ncbi:MAG: phospho-sugar mutase [Verrucomicrobiota bacterium]